MAFDPVHQRRLAEPAPQALDEGELDIIEPLPASPLEDVRSQLLHRFRHIHTGTRLV